MTIRNLTAPDLHMQETVLLLEPEDFEGAAQTSREATTEQWQWQRYLKALGQATFCRWLNDRTSLPLDDRGMPYYVPVFETVSQLEVGDWHLCLIVTDSVSDEWVSVPRAVLDLPEFAAHLYVLLEVQEEQEQVVLRGCLRNDQWRRVQQSVRPEPNWTYECPIDWFDPDANHLLFYLRFLEPASIPLPEVVGSVRSRLRPVQAALKEKLPRLQLENLWQQLGWEEGAALLTCPPLLDLLYRLQTQAATPQFGQVLHRLTGQSLNVWHWFQPRLNGWEASWSLPQVLTPATAMRHTTDKIEAAIADLIHEGLPIPQDAQYAVTSLEHSVQLGIVAWLVNAGDETGAEAQCSEPELARWALVVILTAEPGSTLPLGTRLRLATTTPLVEVALEREDLYLYTPVEGSLSEEFVVTIELPNHLPLTLPAFSCCVGEDGW